MIQELDHPKHARSSVASREKAPPLLHEFATNARTSAPLQTLFEKVERAKQEWEATADALPELICLVDERGHILRANRTIEDWQLGQVTAVQGLAFHRLIHPHCTDLFCHLSLFLQQALRQVCQGQAAELETYDPLLDRHLWIRVQPVPVRQSMAFRVAVVVVQDVTQSKQAEHVMRRYTERLQAMGEIQKAILAARSPEEIAQAALSRIRKLVPFHQARVTLFKSHANEFLALAADANGETHLRPGKSFPGEVFRGNAERWPAHFFAVEDLTQLADPSPMELQLANEGIRAYVSIPMIAEGEFIGSLSLGAKHPKAFAADHVPIAREVADLLAIAIRQAQLYEKVNRMNVELEAALQAKDEMIRNVSHELRTPLAMICGYVELLEDDGLGPLTDAQVKAMRVMRRHGDRLHFMVDRLLTLQTFQANQLQRAQIDLNEWLSEILRPWNVRAAQAAPGIQIELEQRSTLPPLAADPAFLGQVLDNLLDNAIKFSPQGGRVRVWAEAYPDHLILAVSDAGIGISLDKLNQLFQRFSQIDGSSTRRFGGMGIGLALCRAIVEAHGGRIWVESPGEGQGSTFYIALPINYAAQASVN